ncbi:hypothetical protein HYH03_017008 [Edaphochlamys debaryana]|uniref:Protein kinase domain-containing protein n=1 Tax=Edaphochlamys debaryana TaxID=47281 RepID=A0A836BPC7_9CHLO|nr:hypothetical protein HYH03_017008 [Edaphochlamys debaryana]|eukprot:KAG2484196.1 hypothetical protein HYH03_017008 [Edaphochlamys debaryana]
MVQLLLVAVYIAASASLGAAEHGESVTARVASGRELALALTEAVTGGTRVIELSAPEVNLTDADWAGIALPLTFPAGRTMTIRGDPGLPSGPPIVRMTTTPAVKILDNSTFVFEGVILDSFVYQRMSFFRTPSLTLFTYSPEGTKGALLSGRNMNVINPFCLPWEAWEQNVASAARPPLLPGQQAYDSHVDQGTCAHDPALPPLQRCWPARYNCRDVGIAGAQLNAAGNPVATNYDFQLLNVTVLCTVVVDRACVDAHGPVGCIIMYERGLAGAYLPATPPPQPQPSLPLGVAAADGGVGHTGSAGLLAGCIVGGVVLLLVVLAIAGLLLRRRWARSQAQAPADSGPSALPSPAPKYLRESSRETGTISTSLESGSCAVGAHGGTHGGGHESACTPASAAAAAAFGLALSRERSGSGASPGCSQAAPPSAEAAPLAARAAGAWGPGEVVRDQTPLRAVAVAIKVDTSAVPDLCPPSDPLSPNGEGGGPVGPVAGPGQQGQEPEPGPGPGPGADNVVRLTGAVLGKGAFGRVYEGWYRGRLVAVKQLLEAGGGGGGAACAPEEAQETYRQELEVLGRCDHPNIVRVLAACVGGTPRPVMVLERMDTSLDKMLYGGTATLLPLRLVLHVGTQVAQGLSYLHPTILHRDLKPANVLISNPPGEAPVVKLSDFGLSRLRHSALETDRPEAGTPAYMSPECFDINCSAITHRTDVYAFGVLLWEMLAGAVPWKGRTAVQIAYEVALLNHRLPVPPRTCPGGCVEGRWTPRLRGLLAACFERDPWRRPAAAEVAKTLALALQDLDCPSPQRPSADNPSPAALDPGLKLPWQGAYGSMTPSPPPGGSIPRRGA